MVTLDKIKEHRQTKVFIQKADEHVGAIGLTEHGERHAELVANISQNALVRLGFPKRTVELAGIAGYLHDIGNAISRKNHGQTGALLAKGILEDLKMDPEEMMTILGAIGNHEEEYGQPVNKVAAALILADKSDVHRTRVRNTDLATFEIHDRVNYAVTKSFLRVEEENRSITLELDIDDSICPVMEYFEIFLDRMIMCRRAADVIGVQFQLVINNNKLL